MVRAGGWVAVALVAAVLLTGCGGSAAPYALLPTSRHVGSLVHTWSEADTTEAPGVRELRREYVAPQLIADKAGWQRFVRGLPPSLRSTSARRDLDRVDLSDSVIVVAAYGKCTEVSHLESAADGGVDFVVKSNARVNCAWSPTRLEVWQVPLGELEVTDRSDVHLVD